jgi:hypothetical protein
MKHQRRLEKTKIWRMLNHKLKNILKISEIKTKMTMRSLSMKINQKGLKRKTIKILKKTVKRAAMTSKMMI